MSHEFIFNLETREVVDERPISHYHILYYTGPDDKKIVELGNGLRKTEGIYGEYWNRLVKMIRDNELDESGIEAITRGLMSSYLPEEFEGSFLDGIRSGVIGEV
tara:strand:- start:306 stop:617 length:312 start_codon:yes stop_codon:yes gene_type:complete